MTLLGCSLSDALTVTATGVSIPQPRTLRGVTPPTEHNTRELFAWRDLTMNPTAEELRYECQAGPFKLQVLRDWDDAGEPARWYVSLGVDREYGQFLASGALPLYVWDADAKPLAERAALELARHLRDGTWPSPYKYRWRPDEAWARALLGQTALRVETATARVWNARCGPIRLTVYELGAKGWRWSLTGEPGDDDEDLDQIELGCSIEVSRADAIAAARAELGRLQDYARALAEQAP